MSRITDPVLTSLSRVVSSAGRATRLHRVGRGFEPLTTHQEEMKTKNLETSACFWRGLFGLKRG